MQCVVSQIRSMKKCFYGHILDLNGKTFNWPSVCCCEDSLTIQGIVFRMIHNLPEIRYFNYQASTRQLFQDCDILSLVISHNCSNNGKPFLLAVTELRRILDWMSRNFYSPRPNQLSGYALGQILFTAFVAERLQNKMTSCQTTT